MEKKLRFILIIISVALSLQIVAQDTLLLKPAKNITCFDVDVKGNIFASDDSYTLYKFDVNGKLLTNVNIKSYGELTSIDCTNPFEIYAYYKDQNIVVFYDNMLNVRGEIRLNEHYLTNVSCIARSFDNNIWLIDLSQYKLLKINKKGEVLLESAYLNNILNDDLHTYKIWENNNTVLIADSTVGIYEFDIYCTYSTTYYVHNCMAAESIKNEILLYTMDGLQIYHKLTRTSKPLKHQTPEITALAYGQNKLYCLSNGKIISYPTEL
jgi:hypothetical protein